MDKTNFNEGIDWAITLVGAIIALSIVILCQGNIMEFNNLTTWIFISALAISIIAIIYLPDRRNK